MTLARWLTRDEHDAEDSVQEAYLRAYKYFDSFDGQNPRTWLLSIVRHTFYSAARQRQALSYDDELNAAAWSEAQLAAATELSTESALLRREEQGLIRQALGTLRDEFREVLVLRELEDWSYKDIALMVRNLRTQTDAAFPASANAVRVTLGSREETQNSNWPCRQYTKWSRRRGNTVGAESRDSGSAQMAMLISPPVPDAGL